MNIWPVIFVVNCLTNWISAKWELKGPRGRKGERNEWYRTGQPVKNAGPLKLNMKTVVRMQRLAFNGFDVIGVRLENDDSRFDGSTSIRKGSRNVCLPCGSFSVLFGFQTFPKPHTCNNIWFAFVTFSISINIHYPNRCVWHRQR